MIFYQVKDWHEYQHYKDRNPSWIKLHKKLLDNYEFNCLPLASRALAPMLWLLASEYEDTKLGLIEADHSKIAFRLRTTKEEIDEAIKHLLDKGFLIVYQSASGLLAEPEQNASPETYREYKEYREEPAVDAHAHVEVGKEISKITGWDKSPNWTGDYGRIEQWLANGWDAGKDIIPTVKRLMGKRSGPPGNLKYFEQAIADAHASRIKPLPEGKAHEINSRNSNWTNKKSKSDELDDILAEYLDEPESQGPIGANSAPVLRSIQHLRTGPESPAEHAAGVRGDFSAIPDRKN